MMKGAEMDEHHPREGEENPAGTIALRDRIAGLMGQVKPELAELVARARSYAAQGKSVLVITHERCEAGFKAIPGVRTLHHGDLAGD